MKIVLAFAAMLTGVLFAPNVHAQLAGAQEVTPALLTKIDVLPVSGMCSTRGAFQYQWGSTELPPSLFSTPGLDKFDLPPSVAPFREGAFSGTKWSNRFFMANYDLYVTRKEDVPAVIERLAQHFRAAGWVERKGGLEDDGPMIDFPPAAGDVAFYSEAGGMDPARRTGVRASLSHVGGGWISFECVSMPLIVAQFHEAFGDLPADTPKPIAPDLPRPALLDPEACSTPEGIAQLEATVGSGSDANLRYFAARNSYREKLTEWKTNRLEKLGKVSKDRILELLAKGFEASGGDPTALIAIFKDIGQVAKLRKSGNRTGACRALVTMLRKFEQIDAATGKQWDAMNAALDAEAARVGMSFD